MALNLKNLSEPLKAHYEKAIAFAVLVMLLGSLVYLAVQVSLIRRKDTEWRSQIESMRPAHPTAEEVAEAPFMDAMKKIARPPQVCMENWTNAMLTIPETRAYCGECGQPLPMSIAANQGICFACGTKQKVDPVDDPKRDLDKDGMLDVWELEHGLDPVDSTDAQKDRDRDLFTNLEEFHAGTDPKDPKSFPPIEAKIYVSGIDADPFKLRFKSVIKVPPTAVAESPSGNVVKLPVRTRIIAGEPGTLILPDGKKMKLATGSVIESLGGLSFKAVSKNDENAVNFKISRETRAVVSAAGNVEIPGMKKTIEPISEKTAIKCVDRKFALNLKTRKTYFKFLGETVMGFKLARYEEKSEKRMRSISSKPVDVDVSELTLERGKKKIVLVKDKDVMHSEYTVHLLFTLDGSKYTLKVDEIFEIKDTKYRLITVDSESGTVVLERIHDKKRFTIQRAPHQRGLQGD